MTFKENGKTLEQHGFEFRKGDVMAEEEHPDCPFNSTLSLLH